MDMPQSVAKGCKNLCYGLFATAAAVYWAIDGFIRLVTVLYLRGPAQFINVNRQ